MGGRKAIAPGMELCVLNMSAQTKQQYKMNAQHDWLGDVAENYVGYCFAREDFEVFGSGKWTADLMVRDPQKSNRGAGWLRVEVKSTDGNRWPWVKIGRETRKKIFERSELYAEVRIRDREIEFRLAKVPPDRLIRDFRDLKCAPIEKTGDIRKFLNKKWAVPD